ncbi:MAG: DUF5711 family protein [Bacillota bacterium]
MKKLGKVILTLLMLTIAGTMIFFSFEENQKWFVRYIDSFRDREMQVVENSYISGDGIRFINGRYLFWNGEKISVSDEAGKILWERTFLMDEALLDIRDNLMGVYDRINGEALVFNVNGEMLAHIEEEGPIFSFRAGKNGHIIHLKEEGRQVLKIYDKDGTHKNNLIYTKEYPIDYYLEDGSAVVTLLHMEDQGLTTKVVRHNEDVEHELYSVRDRIIISVEKVVKDNLLVTDSGIYLQQDGEVIWGRDFPLLKDVKADGNEIYVVYGDNLKILDQDGATLYQETFGIDYKRLHAHGKYMIIVGERDILVMQHMETVASYSFSADILDIQSQFNDLVVTTENGVSILRIEEKQEEIEEEQK